MTFSCFVLLQILLLLQGLIQIHFLSSLTFFLTSPASSVILPVNFHRKKFIFNLATNLVPPCDILYQIVIYIFFSLLFKQIKLLFMSHYIKLMICK